MGVHQLLLSIIQIHSNYLDSCKKIEEIETRYGEEVFETIKKISMATGLSINDIEDNMNSYLSNYGIKIEDAVKMRGMMPNYLERDSLFRSNNWRKMHGMPMRRKYI